uniref:Sugar phosphate transporter domain-containing protein n=1 Tax=Entomoneis paludosa TaxID=265537 RepID=A0A7S2YRJ9_9STRA|eukprot:CAMPEP_0172441304 /NCGR_PEP_ID=MMETSP1065-20121228/1843_1 /TAXON_ID=265537 /ORGANISM="Amphiprora paludosa, Strain CCMP125" /LENGTH=378 /DNA_ID=CAMNT_0013190573 /DNA_START=91 /DNA_END=1227 /DNA_ORIENTATION=+
MARMSTVSPTLDRTALFYMGLLALQFGIQPLLTRKFTPPGITRSTVILVQELLKFVMAFGMLQITNHGGARAAMKGWSVWNWIQVAGVPAALYAVQNMAALKAYQNLDALTFNVLNQTKTLSAALCCYLIMGKRQSKLQVVALILLLTSALVMEKIVKVNDVLGYLSFDYWKDSSTTQPQELAAVSDVNDTSLTMDASGDSNTPQTLLMSLLPAGWNAQRFFDGVAPILLASFISGLAGALSQMNLQKSTGARNAYLFSMELCVASILLLGGSLLISSDGQLILQKGFFHGWTPSTLIPIVTNAMGGIVVGLVTKYAGSVRKGFALIFGILLSGLMQAASSTGEGVGVSREQVWGGLLAGVSLYIHATNPPLKVIKQD